jgi:hypothetical protein
VFFKWHAEGSVLFVQDYRIPVVTEALEELVDHPMSVNRKVSFPVGRLGMRGLLSGKRAAIFEATFGHRLPGSLGRKWF